MFLEIISILEDTIRLTFEVYEADYLRGENKKTALQLRSNLRRTEAYIHECKQHDSLSNEVLPEVKLAVKFVNCGKLKMRTMSATDD